MSEGTRDLTKRSAVAGLAAWLGKGSGAIVVMVLRAEDHVFYVDPKCSAVDAADVVRLCLEDMVNETKAERTAAAREADAVKLRKEARRGIGR